MVTIAEPIETAVAMKPSGRSTNGRALLLASPAVPRSGSFSLLILSKEPGW